MVVFGYQYKYNETWECDECGARTMFKSGDKIKFRYCVHCGKLLTKVGDDEG